MTTLVSLTPTFKQAASFDYYSQINTIQEVGEAKVVPTTRSNDAVHGGKQCFTESKVARHNLLP
jgi:hypothetical protein